MVTTPRMSSSPGHASAPGPASPASSSSSRLSVREEDVVKLACEFLQNRQLHISQATLERETGVINGCFSDDLLFLRQLILDGAWEDAVEFVAPLRQIKGFDADRYNADFWGVV